MGDQPLEEYGTDVGSPDECGGHDHVLVLVIGIAVKSPIRSGSLYFFALYSCLRRSYRCFRYFPSLLPLLYIDGHAVLLYGLTCTFIMLVTIIEFDCCILSPQCLYAKLGQPMALHIATEEYINGIIRK
jgi:hypothetical protein